MKKIFYMCLVLLASVAAYAQKPAVVADSKPGWHRIGGLQANFNKQDESLQVLGNDEFTALKFKIVDAPIHIDRMQVFYESGDMEDIDVKKDMKAGESTGALQLKHAGRDISKIAFTYKSLANSSGEKAELEIYGLKTGSDAYNKTEADVKDAKEDVKRESHDAANGVENAAEKTGDEISEAAAKTAAEIDDKRLDGKVGPDGQVVYISDDGKYYYISEEGKRVFVTDFQLKDK